MEIEKNTTQHIDFYSELIHKRRYVINSTKRPSLFIPCLPSLPASIFRHPHQILIFDY